MFFKMNKPQRDITKFPLLYESFCSKTQSLLLQKINLLSCDLNSIKEILLGQSTKQSRYGWIQFVHLKIFFYSSIGLGPPDTFNFTIVMMHTKIIKGTK